MKRCSKCKQVLPRSAFHKHSKRRDGLQDWCKLCFLPLQQAYRQTPGGKAVHARSCAKYYRTTHGKAVHRRGQKNRLKRYRERHPERIAAIDAVYYAVKTGRLQLAQSYTCTCCKTAKAVLYHHESYLRKDRLNVKPLCLKCHQEIHQTQRSSDNETLTISSEQLQEAFSPGA